MEDSDARLVAASLSRPQLFGEIFDRHADPIFRFLARRVGADEAGALLSDVFRVAFERRTVFDGSRSSALPWLYGIALNQVRGFRRKEQRRLRAEAELASMSPEVSDGPDVATIELLPRVAEEIEALPAAEREALLLFALEALPYAEIAVALGVPTGTVRSRIHRARQRLRAVVGGSVDGR